MVLRDLEASGETARREGKGGVQHGQVQLCWFVTLTLRKKKLLLLNTEKNVALELLQSDWLISQLWQRAIVRVWLISHSQS